VGGEGECLLLEGDPTPICIASATDLAPCGNELNARCANDPSVCLTLGNDPGTPDIDESLLSYCALGCDDGTPCPDDATVCSDDVTFNAGGDGPFGVCVPPTAVDDPCGAGEALLLCGPGQSCAPSVGETGACVADE
jgi:hypothetical protein